MNARAPVRALFYGGLRSISTGELRSVSTRAFRMMTFGIVPANLQQ